MDNVKKIADEIRGCIESSFTKYVVTEDRQTRTVIVSLSDDCQDDFISSSIMYDILKIVNRYFSDFYIDVMNSKPRVVIFGY